MLKPLIYFVCFLLALSTFAKGDVYFSSAISLLAEVDTVSLNLNLHKAEEFQKENPDSSFFYFNNAIVIANELAQQKQRSAKELREIEEKKATSLKGLGLYYDKSSDLDKALTSYLQVLEIYEALIVSEKSETQRDRYVGLRGDIELTIGAVYFERGDYLAATDFYNKTLDDGELLKDSLMQSKALLNLGMIYNNQGRYDQAINNYYTAIKIFESSDDKRGMAICNLSIGNILRKQSTLDKAIESYKKALQIFQEIDDERGISSCYNNLGICYANKDEYEQALDYYNKSVELYLKNNGERYVANLYTNIAALYEEMGDYDTSLEYVEKSLIINKRYNFKRNLIASYLNLAGTNLSKIQNSKETILPNAPLLDTIVVYARKAMALADSLQLIQEEAGTLAVLKDAYSLKKNYVKAYESANLLLELNDSIYNVEKTKIVAESENKYEASKKEQQIEKQEHQLRHQKERLKTARIFRNFLIAISILMVLVVLMIFYYYKQKHKANQILDEKSKLIEKQNDEILIQKEELQRTNQDLTELLRFKEKMIGMIVHDLKNPLNNIMNSYEIDDEVFRKDLIKQSGYDMLNLIQNILDVYKLEEAKLELLLIPVNGVQILKESVSEFSLYISAKDLTIVYPKKGVPPFEADKRLLKRIFSNLLSNAIKYAPLESEVICTAESSKNQIRFGVCNFGPAIPAEQQANIFKSFQQHNSREMGLTSSTGLGLSFCKMAVQLHGGEIGVISNETGTEFWFTLPIHS